jgi:1,4-dihydroxy-2-naphthoate octaprenyltransferase
VIQKGWINARSLARFGYVTFALGILFGLYPLITHFSALWPIALLSLIGVAGYSGAPFRFKYRALGDLVVFLLCGPFLVYGFSEVSFDRFGFPDALVGAVFGLAALGILHANNLNDLEIDLSRGARTIANRLGFQSSKRYLYLIYALIAALLVLSAATKLFPIWFSLAPALLTPLVLRLLLKVKNASGPLSPSIIKIRFDAAQIHLLIGLTWLLALGVGSLWRAT